MCPVAALISIEDVDWESISLSMNPEFIALIERARERARREGTVSHEEVLQEFGITEKPRKLRHKRV
jgi:hypothetical protein